MKRGFIYNRGICGIHKHLKASMIFGMTTTTTKLTLGTDADVKSMTLLQIAIIIYMDCETYIDDIPILILAT